MEKAPDAFRTISEVAEELALPQHVLRFWETRFAQIKPMKRGGGRRYYRPDDVDLLRGIRHLLYGEGYTIRGVQRILKDAGIKFVQAVWRTGAPQPVRSPEDADLAAEEAVASGAYGEQGGRGLLGLWPSILGDIGSGADASAAERIEPSLAAAEPARAEGPLPDRTEPIDHDADAASQVQRENVRVLQAALFELDECRRLLDAAFSEDGGPGSSAQ